MAEWLTTHDDIADELERIGFKPNSADRYDFTGRMLRARIVQVPGQTLTWKQGGQERQEVTPPHFVVHFAEKRTFDRWANSTNFVVCIDPENHSARLEQAAKHARRICRAKVFNFNSYFHPIDLS